MDLLDLMFLFKFGQMSKRIEELELQVKLERNIQKKIILNQEIDKLIKKKDAFVRGILRLLITFGIIIPIGLALIIWAICALT